MFEDSVDNFISRWQRYAASVELFSHIEGSPLIECKVDKAILHIFERTGPYFKEPGLAKVVLNPTVDEVQFSQEQERLIDVIGISRMRFNGLVLSQEDRFIIVDAGVPLVVSVQGSVPNVPIEGVWVSCESIAPVHGFLLPRVRSSALTDLANIEAD
ncbi:MAG: hypothetical protein JSV66_00580 [Trueperaceae bacterium]|nr:MAG: hypothetical protein JSV66_00580 [Trueperaceae bacterium]